MRGRQLLQSPLLPVFFCAGGGTCRLPLPMLSMLLSGDEGGVGDRFTRSPHQSPAAGTTAAAHQRPGIMHNHAAAHLSVHSLLFLPSPSLTLFCTAAFSSIFLCRAPILLCFFFCGRRCCCCYVANVTFINGRKKKKKNLLPVSSPVSAVLSSGSSDFAHFAVGPKLGP